MAKKDKLLPYVTVHVGIEVRKEMAKHPDINWSKVARLAFCRKMGIKDPTPQGKIEALTKEVEKLRAQLNNQTKAKRAHRTPEPVQLRRQAQALLDEADETEAGSAEGQG